MAMRLATVAVVIAPRLLFGGRAVWHELQTHGHNAGSHEPRSAGKHWGQEGRASAISWALEGDRRNTSLRVGWCTTGKGLC